MSVSGDEALLPRLVNLSTSFRKLPSWTTINRLSVIWKSYLIDKMKRSYCQAAIVLILLYGCTTWTLTKQLEKKLDVNYTRMLRAILNKSWRQHPTKQQLYGHLPPVTKPIQVRRTRHTGRCWRSRDELIRDVLLWIPLHGRAKVGRSARTDIQQLCEDSGYSPEDPPEAMNDSDGWQVGLRDICADGTTRWWWWCSDNIFYCLKYRTCQSVLLNVYFLPRGSSSLLSCPFVLDVCIHLWWD